MSERTTVLCDGENTVAVRLVKSARRRTIAVVVRGGVAEVRIPAHRSYEEGERYLRKVADWTLRKVAEQRAVADRDDGFLLWGKLYRPQWTVAPRYGYSVDGDTLFVRCPEGRREQALARIRKTETKAFVLRTIAEYCARMNIATPAVKVVDVRSYYGKCFRSAREVRFAASLSKFPPRAGEYVVVHELCHFEIPNHSRAFYDAVERVLPDYRVGRRLLKHF